jgi:hypothetical protein
MRLTRTAVIKAIDEIEADRKARHEAAQLPRAQAWEKAVDDYKNNRSAALAKQLRDLAEKARRGTLLDSKTITKALGLDTYGERNGVFRGFVQPKDPTSPRGYNTLSEKPKPAPYTPDRELGALRRVLTQMTDDEHVTTSVLRELGFSPSLFIKKSLGAA